MDQAIPTCVGKKRRHTLIVYSFPRVTYSNPKVTYSYANTTSTSAAAAVFVMSHALHLTICIDIHQSINITPTIHNALACS